MHTVFNNWQEFETYLDGLGLFRMSPGIGRVEQVLRGMGLLHLPMPLAQIVGTNGKGSTCTFLAALAREHGVVCGLHSSPHFVSVRERLRIFRPGGSADHAGPASRPEGDLLPEADWLEAANAIMAHGGEALTYFELVTAMAVYMLNKQKVGLAVMETGLGGSFDATTALHADLVVFTPIALDHCAVLGGTLSEIARDKAGAIRQGLPAISARQQKAAENELKAAAAAKGAELSFIGETSLLPEVFKSGAAELGLAGGHQLGNAALALAAWRKLAPLLGVKIGDSQVRKGLQTAWLPGRMQFCAANPRLRLPALLLDGGHNAHGLAALGHSLALQGIAPGAVIFSCLADKEPEKLLPHLRALATGPVFVPQIQNNPRAMQAEELAALIGLAATPTSTLWEALDLAYKSIAQRLPEELERGIEKEGGHPLLICGSLYLLGEFYALYPQYLSKEQA